MLNPNHGPVNPSFEKSNIFLRQSLILFAVKMHKTLAHNKKSRKILNICGKFNIFGFFQVLLSTICLSFTDKNNHFKINSQVHVTIAVPLSLKLIDTYFFHLTSLTTQNPGVNFTNILRAAF